MAVLVPFRALRPAPPVAARVAAVPYDVVNTEEARALAAGNPLSFLHASRPEIDLPAGTSSFADQVYLRAAANFDQLRREAPLVLEDAPTVYLYRLSMGAHEQIGVAACFSVEEYDRGQILKHERTRLDKEDDRTRHMLGLRAQTGPVFLTYRARPVVDTLVEQVTGTVPLYDFTAADGVRHTVWRTEAPLAHRLREAFVAVPALYIADGHHRAASAARARQRLGGGEPGEWDWFLGVAFPHSQVRILAYNRVVTDLGGHTPDAFLRGLGGRFTLRDGPAIPERRGEVAMFLGDRWRTIEFGGTTATASPADRLDVARLQDGVLGPLLQIGDVRTDPRIDFVGGSRGTTALEDRVRSGSAAVAFSLHPVSVEDLMAISDGGGMMPPKSTWFEPKLRDGLLTHLI
jgi:uncharacterized protein (DUF1015 family)